MPNAMNKYRPNQLVKVEKENENQVIRRKLKTINKDKSGSSRTETVWERLSKVKRCPSNEGSLSGSTKSRLTFLSGSAHRLPPLRSLPPAALGANKRMYLSNAMPCSRAADSSALLTAPAKTKFSAKRNSFENRPLTKKKQPTLGNAPEELSYMCKAGRSMKEIMTARSMCNSRSSSDGSSMKTSRMSLNESAHSRCSMYYSQLSGYDSSELFVPRSIRGVRRSARSAPSIHSSEKEQQQSLKSAHGTETSISLDSCEYFDVAPLIQLPPRDSLNSSVKIAKNFRGLLKQKQKTMPAEEIDVIKDVVKSDERHHQLQRNDAQLFKDILKTQLQEILRQELVVKSALNKLDSTASTPKASGSELPSTKLEQTSLPVEQSIVRTTESTQQKPKVDVIFKNVPTLEKEIIILKALGEKLEATLKRTVMKSGSVISPPRMTKMVVKLCQRGWVLAIEHHAQVQVQVHGVRQVLGFVKEFRIAHKTIVQLKEEAHRHFYLPVNHENTELKRTSFKKLKENPDVLMRYLRPKNSQVNFNVLEQDRMFFNSFLVNNAPAAQLQSDDSAELTSICEGGDSRQLSARGATSTEECRWSASPEQCRWQAEQQQPDETRAPSIGDADTCMQRKSVISVPVVEPELQKMPELQKKLPKPRKAASSKILCAETAAVNQRQRLWRSRTPMPLNKTLEPKNSLIKTLLVGSVQVSVFLLLIMAFTYPDAKC